MTLLHVCAKRTQFLRSHFNMSGKLAFQRCEMRLRAINLGVLLLQSISHRCRGWPRGRGCSRLIFVPPGPWVTPLKRIIMRAMGLRHRGSLEASTKGSISAGRLLKDEASSTRSTSPPTSHTALRSLFSTLAFQPIFANQDVTVSTSALAT